jgi:hypothetical protein
VDENAHERATMTGCVEVQDLGTVAILMRPKLSPGRRERSLRIETLASALTETLAHWFGVDFVDVDFPFGVLVEEIVVVTNVDLRPADLEELIGSVEVDDDLCVAAAGSWLLRAAHDGSGWLRNGCSLLRFAPEGAL